MLRLFCIFLLLTGLFTGCGDRNKNVNKQQESETLLLYSELDQKFTEDLISSFNANNKSNFIVKAIYDLKNEDPLPELLLAEQRTLVTFKLQDKLHSITFAAGDRLPKEFRGKDSNWYGVFYDPTVFLVNQQYARTIGQSNIYSWNDLQRNPNLRIAMENLSDTDSTQNFLGALADHFGESAALNYLWNIHHFVKQYSKFPFTPIRMTAVGDADVAITRQSYVFKYLENQFPAYVVIPKEGTPVNLYGIAMLKNSKNNTNALAFMEWLLADEKVQAIAQADATGYMFLFPRGIKSGAVSVNNLWLNKNYLTKSSQDALTSKWLEKVRFSH